MALAFTEQYGRTVFRAGSNAALTALSRIRSETPLLQFNATGEAASIAWSDGGAGGSFQLSGTNNDTAVYTPANRTQTVAITADDGTTPVTHTYAVTGTLPLQPQVNFEVENDIDTKVKYARDRTPYFREDGSIEIGWMLGFDNRSADDMAELKAFWEWHRKSVLFWLVDVESNLQNLVYFLSSFKRVFLGANRWQSSVAVRGISSDTEADAVAITKRINAGGFEVGTFSRDEFYTNGQTIYIGAITPDTGGATSPAPDEAYRWCRYDSTQVAYCVTGLRGNALHTVRLHFCISEGRTLQPVIQGVTQSNVVVPVDYEVEISEYAAVQANAQGEITIAINKVSGANALLSALEVIET